MNQNDNQTHEVLQEWRDENGNVDLEAVRSGMVDIRHQDAIWSALLDEVEEMRSRLMQLSTLQDRIPDDLNGDWGIGWDDGYNAALSEVRAIAKGGDL